MGYSLGAQVGVEMLPFSDCSVTVIPSLPHSSPSLFNFNNDRWNAGISGSNLSRRPDESPALYRLRWQRIADVDVCMHFHQIYMVLIIFLS